MPNTFDASAFLETTFKGGQDTSYVLPDEGDYPAQATDKIDYNAGYIQEGKNRGGEPWANVTVYWKILDDKVRQKLNLSDGQDLIVRQSIMLDLAPGSTPESPIIDWGTNKNMRLKRTLEATGLNKKKGFTLNELKFANATVHIAHRRPDGFDDDVAEVTRVAPYNGHG